MASFASNHVRGANLTSLMIKEIINKNMKMGGSKADMISYVNKKIAFEKMITQTEGTVCNLPKADPGKIDWKEVSNQMGDSFYNINVLRAVACSVDSLIYTPSNSKMLSFTNRARESLIKHLKVIGGESAYGFVISADVGDAEKLLAIKVPRKGEGADLVHEETVGIFGTNDIRELIPTFVFVFGGVLAPPPIFSEKREIVSIATDGNGEVPYVIYENIRNSVTLSDCIERQCSAESFVANIIQVCLALQLAYDRIDFTHYDLHDKNVLQMFPPSENKKKIQISFPVRGKTYYVLSDSVSVIIDYGRSFFKYKSPDGNVYALGTDEVGLMPYGINPKESFIISDIYKLVMFCMLKAYSSKNGGCYYQALNMFRFFNKIEDPIKALNEQYSHKYSWQRLEGQGELTPFDFLQYLMETSPVARMVVSEKKYDGADLIGCQYQCSSFESVAELIGLDQRPQKVVSTIQASGMKYPVNVDAFVEKDLDLIKKKADKMVGLAENAKKVLITEVTKFDYPFLLFVMAEYQIIFSIKQEADEIIHLMDAVSGTTDKYNDFLHNLYLAIKNYLSPLYCELVSNDLSNYMVIEKVIKSENWDEVINYDGRLIWLKTHLPNILVLGEKCHTSKLLDLDVKLKDVKTPLLPKRKEEVCFGSDCDFGMAYRSSLYTLSDY